MQRHQTTMDLASLAPMRQGAKELSRAQTTADLTIPLPVPKTPTKKKQPVVEEIDAQTFMNNQLKSRARMRQSTRDKLRLRIKKTETMKEIVEKELREKVMNELGNTDPNDPSVQEEI